MEPIIQTTVNSFKLLERIDQLDLAMYYVVAVCLCLVHCFGSLALRSIGQLQRSTGLLGDFQSLAMAPKLHPMRKRVTHMLIAPFMIAGAMVFWSLLDIPQEFTAVIYSVSFIILISCIAYNYNTYRDAARTNGEVVYKLSQKTAIERKLAKIKEARDSQALEPTIVANRLAGVIVIRHCARSTFTSE